MSSNVEAMETGVAALEISGLHKAFGDTVAVRHVGLTVPRGSFFGLVGPNGAGKTTLLSMAVGLLRPDEGSARVFDADVWTNPLKAKKLMGVLPDGLALPEWLTGRELLTYLGRLGGLEDNVVSERTQELLEVMDLIDAERTLVIDYSTGMRKKIGLATALLFGPRLLVLDEPFEAIDPVSAATLKTILKRFVDNEGSIVFSSHVMALVEQLCDTVAVMSDGVVAGVGSLDEISAGRSLEEAFVALVGEDVRGEEGLTWLSR
jgi:ABC-2 type transport system ATP-binding protein